MGPFEKLDTYLEDEVKKYQVIGKIPKLEDVIQNSDESVLKITNLGLNIFALFVPLVITYGCYLYTSSVKNEIQTRQNIVKAIHDFSRFKTKLSTLEKKIVSKLPIPNQNALKTTLQAILARGTKTKGNVKIVEFDQQDKGETILITQGIIEYSNFSQMELSSLTRKMITGYKMKILDAEVLKNEKTNFLNGMFRFSHYGKK